MLKFYVKVLKTLYFLNPQTDLVYIWYNYRCWSKILLSTIQIPALDLEVKVMDLEILYSSFASKILDLIDKLKFSKLSCLATGP